MFLEKRLKEFVKKYGIELGTKVKHHYSKEGIYNFRCRVCGDKLNRVPSVLVKVNGLYLPLCYPCYFQLLSRGYFVEEEEVN